MTWVWKSGVMKFVAGENERNFETNLTRLDFAHHETEMEWLRCELGTPEIGGEHLTIWAKEPPFEDNIKLKYKTVGFSMIISFKNQVTYRIMESTKFKPIRIAYPWIFIIFFLSTLSAIVFLERTSHANLWPEKLQSLRSMRSEIQQYVISYYNLLKFVCV